MTQPAEHKAAVRRATKACNKRDGELFKSAYGDEIIVHQSDGEEVIHDVDEHWQGVLDFIDVFPDYEATIESLIGEDDRVFARFTYAGTHDGEKIHDTEPTGTYIEFPHFVEFRFEEGVIVEGWTLTDWLDVFDRLDVVDRPNG